MNSMIPSGVKNWLTILVGKPVIKYLYQQNGNLIPAQFFIKVKKDR